MKQVESSKKQLVYHLPDEVIKEQSKNEKQVPPPERKKPFGLWRERNWYYHDQLIAFYRSRIPRGASVLQVNCTNGYLLASLEPSRAVGIDPHKEFIEEARAAYPNFDFYTTPLSSLPVVGTFDYIILSVVTMEVDDVQQLLEDIRPYCSPKTRVIIETYSHWWQPILWLTQKIGLRRPTLFKNWLSSRMLSHVASLSDFETVTEGTHLLCPIYIPLISTICNAILAHVPGIRQLSLMRWMVVKPVRYPQPLSKFSVSIIVPCKNEAGNIRALMRRCPTIGKSTEIIFVEGNSSDDTLYQLHEVAREAQDKEVMVLVQDGKGKADAVRKGFAHATGDILVILDADLTVPPEELPRFVKALVQGKGDCINGSRLVYGMERGAMGIPSWLANSAIGKLVSWTIGQHITDTLCGTKVFWRDDYERIAQHRGVFGKRDPFGDFDLLLGAAYLHLKTIDLPVHYKQRRYGKSNISRMKDVWFLWWTGFRAMCTMKLRWWR